MGARDTSIDPSADNGSVTVQLQVEQVIVMSVA
jgi:hypothetical protein